MPPNVQRPPFDPTPCHDLAPSLHNSSPDVVEWLPLISCPAGFPRELFEVAISQLIHHPEYNSTLILRSETLSDIASDFPEAVPKLGGFRPTQNIHRRLLPRRPGRDADLEQHCTLYVADDDEHELPSTLVLTPIVQPGSSLPYYHPSVYNLAFRFLATERPRLQIEVKPLPNTPCDINSRLYRTCLALLDTLHRYGWGTLTNYKKRVHHDCLVPREEYQDLYLIMRERHKYMVDEWKEVTDPLKHVFEDIGIATFLILLWKHTFQSNSSTPGIREDSKSDPSCSKWPRPPGGFLDLGCGNGLLTHILIAEGYSGLGLDLRERNSWKHYPESTQACLKVQAFDPTAANQIFLKPGVFIIGNHADELTPWVPVLSTLGLASGYISIPCCAWVFDARYERSRNSPFPLPSLDFADTLNLGGDGSNSSSYSSYRVWLASLSHHLGWAVECETLRIPSTRNWAIIGRRNSDTEESRQRFRARAITIVEDVRERGVFRTRKPEGKAGH